MLTELSDWARYDGRPADAWVMMAYRNDPDEGLKYNAWRKAYLARYGRQSMLQWDNVLVTEIDRLLSELSDIIKRENELSRTLENRQ